jgi:hypothetical protein
MGFRFQLAVYDAAFSRLVPVEEFLRAGEERRWRPSLDDCGFFLECGGREWLGDTFNLGNLALVVRQLEDAAARLDAGAEAIVRSGVLDQDEVPYLLFEPAEDGVIPVSLFFVEDAVLRHAFPHPGFTGDGERLYAHVAANRAALLAQPTAPFGRNFKRVPCPAVELAAAMRREAALGRQLFEVLDVPFREGMSG